MKYIETEKIELKEKYADSIIKDIEAFLNTDGGVIYVGVKDNGEVVGVENLDQVLRKISDIISDQIEPNAIDCVKPEVVFEPEGIIIKIIVNKGYNALYCIRKYGFSSNGCHKRIGTTCKSMTLDMIRNALERGFSDLDLMVKIPSFRNDQKYIKLKLLLIENGFHIDEASFENNLALKNRDGKYNLLGELLADNNNIPFIFAKFKGINKSVYSERTDYGNQCYVLAYEKMKERLKLENICKIDTTVRPRREVYLYDMDVVNEALINAVVHNDYRITDPQVAFFDDRLEITSHGGLPAGLSKEEFLSGISKPRNNHLMDIFMRLGVVEHTGHGVPAIANKYGEDVFTILDNMIIVTIPFNREAMENHGSSSKSILNKGREILNGDELNVLKAIENNNSITTREISDTTSISFRTVQRIVSYLKEDGFITRNGSRKSGTWEVLR